MILCGLVLHILGVPVIEIMRLITVSVNSPRYGGL